MEVIWVVSMAEIVGFNNWVIFSVPVLVLSSTFTLEDYVGVCNATLLNSYPIAILYWSCFFICALDADTLSYFHV
jgi:hypothetical protein